MDDIRQHQQQDQFKEQQEQAVKDMLTRILGQTRKWMLDDIKDES